jgi:ubiquinone/menaquinone biosynthesis C-methylase UbiE
MNIAPEINLADQYKTDENLRIRIETHRLYGIGPPLEPAIDDALNLKPDESLLDIGTGPGDFPIRISRSGHLARLVGIDASPGMVAKAKSAGANVEFFQTDAQSLLFPDESFDVVTARHMLYHVPDIPRTLREAHRVLRPAGRFLAVTNMSNNFAEYRQALHEAADTLKGQIADVLRITVPVSDVFNEKNGTPLIESIFGNVSTTLVEGTLRFETAEPALRYFDSCRSMKGFSPDDWALARTAFAQVIARQLRNGPWIISKTIVLLTASKNDHTKSSI